MKKIFIDCGTHYGQGLKQFIQMYNMTPDWEIYTFEANPVTYAHFLSKNDELIKLFRIKHFNLAVSNSDDIITLNQETPPQEDNSGMGSSVIPLDQWNPWGGELRENFKTSCQIKSINFSNFLKTNFNQNDYILIKMDIEGSEYNVIESLINDSTIQYISDMYVEFHASFFTNMNEICDREIALKNYIKNKTNMNLYEWH